MENGNVRSISIDENITVTEAYIPSSTQNTYQPTVESKRKTSIVEEEAKSTPSESTNIFKSIPDLGNLTTRFVYSLARNLYTIKKIALFLAFVINLMLLFYKVTSYIPGSEENGDSAEKDVGSGEGSASVHESGSEEDEVIEWLQIEESWYYLEPVLRGLAMLHSLLSFFMLIAYYNLKVPLIIFKREKEIARKLEFDGLYITEQPEDNYGAYWDKLVISTKSFPVNYWDKFVKKRVRVKYAEQYDYDTLSKLLGMAKSDAGNLDEAPPTGFFSFITSCDWKYQIWKVGVTFMDNVRPIESNLFSFHNFLFCRCFCTILAISSCH